ncbi:hypothetical protein QR680_009393 [Steinernema hermaphroditum]|uniref:C-type lectin domain-containing protein n=1 Tax=Steinernema hermaphroditum TaxID=289476 RepID=A0AA39IK25_9BILA|nr:hypothetical protein QR680_009393 [Steinernema hermaphroditum]
MVPALLPLSTSLAVATLHFVVDLAAKSTPSGDVFPFVLISPNRNLSVELVPRHVLIDGLPVFERHEERVFRFKLRCLTDAALQIAVNDHPTVVSSPSFCASHHLNELLIGPEDVEPAQLFAGCVRDVRLGARVLLRQWCRGVDEPALADGAPDSASGIQPLYLGEPLEVDEGGRVALQWRNLYVFPEHNRFRIANSDIVFRVVEAPRFGDLLVNGSSVDVFSYEHVIFKRLFYVHDGSETLEDSFDFQLEIKSAAIDFPELKTKVYSIPISVAPKNDAPQLKYGSLGRMVQMAPHAKRWLNEDLLTVWDVDDQPDAVLVTVLEAEGVRLEDVSGQPLHSFSFAQMMRQEVRVTHLGGAADGRLELRASDGRTVSAPLVLDFSSVPLEIHLRSNTGARLLHRSAVVISAANLSFYSNLVESPLTYSIVAQPEFGVVECVDTMGDGHVCATFTQSFIDQDRLRYRHSNNLRPRADSFSFQVTSANVSSRVHTFHITFVAVNVKVFKRETFLLNNTEEKSLRREHLFAWTFPRSLAPPELVYHVVEPPKYGILSRHLLTNRNRRIGVSSNFTQQHIDEGLIKYKLHFVQFSVVNDFFTFRLVTPAVTSELVRFEITFVPGVGSIQLINRTVIVHEGQKVAITNNSLLLETPDDSNFRFTLGVLPGYGSLVLSNEQGARIELSLGRSFSTADVSGGRLFYEHDGGENRRDRFYVVAESVFGGHSRIPFWMTVDVVLVNDNAPFLRGPGRVYVVKRGERVLHSYLLPWTDRDMDSEPLQFSFDEVFRDVAILTQEIPQVPVRNFSARDLAEQKLVLRHTGTNELVRLGYAVSDGKHVVRAELEVLAGAPFVRLERGRLELPRPMAGSWVPVGPANLSIATNLDVDAADIVFTVVDGSRFLAVADGATVVANSFTQKDVDAGVLLYSVEGAEGVERLLVRVADHTLSATVDVVSAASGVGLEVTALSTLHVPLSAGVAPISSTTLATSSKAAATTVTYIILTQPTKGSLLLEEPHGEKRMNVAMSPSNYFVRHFTQEDVDRGLLQYLPSVQRPTSDFFTFNVTNGLVTIGPFSLHVEIVDNTVELRTATVVVAWGGSATLDTKAIRAPPQQNVHVVVAKAPRWGRIVRADTPSGTLLETFGFDDVEAGRVLYVHAGEPPTAPASDAFFVKACLDDDRCSASTKVDVVVRKTNVHGPELVRNDALRPWSGANGSVALSNRSLLVTDSDSLPEELQILVSNPLNGFLARRGDLSRPVANFSQRDVDERAVFFVCAERCARTGGFSFLVSDGRFQIGPEWFAVEAARKLPVALEANNRLSVAPGERAPISADLLKANLPQIPPENIVYRIVRPPKLGVMLNAAVSASLPVTSFSQADVDARRVEYVQNGALRGWSAKDYFLFVVNSNLSEPINEEFRFRISDQAGTSRSRPTVALFAGGSVAINRSHVDLSALENALGDSLLVDVYRTPRSGLLERTVVPEVTVLTSDQLHSGRHLIYHSKGVDDTVLLHVYPKQFARRKTDRLRVPLAITVDRSASPDVRIETFPKAVTVVSGGRTGIDGAVFQTVHGAKKPSELEYILVQRGSNGVGIRLAGLPVERFTQADVNKGRLEVVHGGAGAIDAFDVLVFAVEGHTRALVVGVHPLSLTLVNHSVIAYVQGKTYVVLNRQVARPENGTFYWVAGEKEAKAFSQKNVDDGDVLYAQLNMNAFQDSFDFSVGNGNNESIEASSTIVVLSAVEPHKLVVDGAAPVAVTVSHLNASVFEGTAPRFLVIAPPRLGRFFYTNNANASVTFFTFSDIANRRLLYQATHVDKDATDETVLEFRSDSLQPARLTFAIEIRAPSPGLEVIESRSRQPFGPPSERPPSAPPVSHAESAPLNPMVPIGALLGVLALTLLVLFCCRKRSSDDSDDGDDVGFSKRPSDASNVALKKRCDGTDLLDTTVYATIGRHRAESLGAKTPTAKSKFSHPATTSSFEAQPPACKVAPLGAAPTSSTVTFRGQFGGSVGRSASQPRTLQNEAQKVRAKLKEGQYWV